MSAEGDVNAWADDLGPLQTGDIELLDDAIAALERGGLHADHALHCLRKRVEAAKKARAKPVLLALAEVDNHLQELQHYGHSHQLREAMSVVQEMQEALTLFVKQWNACGPNSDFGRYFNRVHSVAIKALRSAGVAS